MEFDLVNHPHPHPQSLIFYEHGKLNDGQQLICCSKCRQPWRPPAFSCSDCNFHLHQSCVHFPPQIRTPFHPQHPPLSLTINNHACNCCYQIPTDHLYRCSECGFQIDLQCAIADPKASGLRRMPTGQFQHFSHPHPLTLHHKHTAKVVCLVCQLLITSGSIYFCSRSDSCSDSYFHQQCAELPREILNLDFHHHPLFLFPRPFVYNSLCDSCRNECVGFFYGCPLCNFNLHVACLSSFKHQHTFLNLRRVLSYDCQACGKSERGFPWFCNICHLFAHKKCADLPLVLQTSEHRHLLDLTFSLHQLGLNNYMCKTCGEEINKSYAAYVCRQCSYVAHLGCADSRRIEIFNEGSVDANNDINLEGGILHFSHEHNLSLCSGGDRHCDGCMRYISTQSQSYGCSQCNYFLHQECARLPTHKTCLFHPHLLNLIFISDFVFSCAVCLQYCHGFAYQCEQCPGFAIDIRCATITIPFTHPSHDHPLSLCSTNEQQNCEACGDGVDENKVAFRCIDCNFHLDGRCATLPIAVKHRFDEHPLNLTFVNEDEKSKEYYCDICEEEREAEQWFYYCRLCCFAAHTSCALGDYPFMKSAKCEGDVHPLSLVKEGKKGYSACRNCGDSCDGNLAFECGRCKFNVHAFGPCYHQQLMQGRIGFTMPFPYSRSLLLYLHPYQRSGSKRISLGPYGGKGGNPWNERAFLTIRRLVVNHGRWIDSIRIEYEKNGNSFWSAKHGGDGGSRSEVVLNYPDEYLVTIEGCYGDIHLGGIATTLIRSLTVTSNRRSYGPFGMEEGTKFSFPNEGMKIVGIHGRSGSYLDSIGLHAISNHV